MLQEEFNHHVQALERECNEVLLNRRAAYADEDRLSNFKQIEALTGVPAAQVCMVLQAKHIVAEAKALREGRLADAAMYIIDIINYQRLLYALYEDSRTPKPCTFLGNPLPEAGYIHTPKRTGYEPHES
jgi:hypothetical protein